MITRRKYRLLIIISMIILSIISLNLTLANPWITQNQSNDDICTLNNTTTCSSSIEDYNLLPYILISGSSDNFTILCNDSNKDIPDVLNKGYLINPKNSSFEFDKLLRIPQDYKILISGNYLVICNSSYNNSSASTLYQIYINLNSSQNLSRLLTYEEMRDLTKSVPIGLIIILVIVLITIIIGTMYALIKKNNSKRTKR